VHCHGTQTTRPIVQRNVHEAPQTRREQHPQTRTMNTGARVPSHTWQMWQQCRTTRHAAKSRLVASPRATMSHSTTQGEASLPLHEQRLPKTASSRRRSPRASTRAHPSHPTACKGITTSVSSQKMLRLLADPTHTTWQSCTAKIHTRLHAQVE
jgi:hypothetical protein